MTQLTAEEAFLLEPDDVPGFSWRAVFAGALVGSAIILFLLFLGAGVGLSLFTVPEAGPRTAAHGITLGAIYFFAAQAFGLVVAGYLSGRLMGPVLESEHEEIFHAATHGLTAWALAVLLTATMVGAAGVALVGPGLNAAAILGAADQSRSSTPSAQDTTGYWVDTLFRPKAAGNADLNAAAPAADANAGATAMGRPDPQARAEAGRILTVGLLKGENLSSADHDQLAMLIVQNAGVTPDEANLRITDVQNRIRQDAAAAAEQARRFARFVSLWLAASLIFGALVASAAAVSGRWVDDEARLAT